MGSRYCIWTKPVVISLFKAQNVFSGELAHYPELLTLGYPNPPDILSSGGDCPMFYGKPTFFSTNFYLDDNCQIGQSECLAVNRAFSLADATLFKPEEA